VRVWGEHSEEWLWVAALTALTAATTATAFWAGGAFGIQTGRILHIELQRLLLVVPLIVIAAAFVLTARAAMLRVQSPIAAFKPFFRERFGSPALAVGTISPLLITPVLMGAFCVFKQLMPLVRPFTWDNDLAALDRALFGGVPPWHLTHAILGSPLATLVIDRIYSAWIPLLFVALSIFAIFAPRELRARFFIAYGATWILLGLIAAYVFSSAGPCYAVNVGSASAGEFAELSQRLRAIDAAGYKLGAVAWQDFLWAAHAEHHYGFGLGVSAMPSMHNAVSFLYFLAAARAGLWLRAATGAFALIILVGSVHLGWHYLTDGLFAWAATAAIWWGAGWFVRRCGFGRAVSDLRANPDLDSDYSDEIGALAA
jgi:hypothetical protein